MASKYLSSGSPAYTASTRKISGGSFSTALGSEDVGKSLVFRIGTAVHYGRISSYTAAVVDPPADAYITLATTGSLPGSNGTIAEMIVLDQGEEHTFTDYLTELDSKIQDQGNLLTQADRKSTLKSAALRYGKDLMFTVRKKIAGIDAQDIPITALGDLFVYGSSMIKSVEFPAGEIPKSILDPDEYELYDDGTAQDGSSLHLRFTEDTPATSEYIVVEIYTPFDLPEVGSQNFPDTAFNFENITLLAASDCCLRLAARCAQSSDPVITADVVNFQNKVSLYQGLARDYMKRYTLNVFGNEEPASRLKAAGTVVDVQLQTSTREPYLFHDRP